MTRFRRSSWETNGFVDVETDIVDDAATIIVPNCGIQFIDIQLSASAIVQTAGRFVEEHDLDHGQVLVPVRDGAAADEPLVHPISGLPLRQDEVLWVSGYQAVEAALGRWLPLPYFRILGRPGRDNLVLDCGPSNWVRIYLERPDGDVRAATHISAVLAIDTRLASDGEETAYLAPRHDDARLESSFALATSPQELVEFLSEDWVNSWLLMAQDAPIGTAGPGETASLCGPLDHIAKYITLTKILGASRQLPKLRFLDGNSARVRQFTVGVDLVLDVGDDLTTAMLVDRNGRDGARGQLGMESLNLRDLSQPTIINSGPFRTIAEFARADFGPVKLSRRSGRPDAFRWPSLTRVGSEGWALSLKASAADGVTGLRSLRSALSDCSGQSSVWRFARDDENTFEAGSMVTGELLNFLSEDGRVITSSDDGLKPAIRPRFSPASVFVLFVTELLLHAVAQLNVRGGAPGRQALRQLDRIVINSSAADTADERGRLAGLVQDAIDLVWTANDWDVERDRPGRARPTVDVGIDPSISAQLIYLLSEVRGKFGGQVDLFQQIKGKRSGRASGYSVKIASVALTPSETTVSIVDYATGAEGEVRPHLLIAERCAVTGHMVRSAMIDGVLKPALTTALAAAGHDRPEELVTELLAHRADVGPLAEIGRRFRSKIAEPAATGLLDVLQRIPETQLGGVGRTVALGDLVLMGGSRTDALAAAVNHVARRGGAADFDLERVEVALRPRLLRKLVERAIAPLADRISDLFRHQAIDLLLLTGSTPVLGDLRRSMIERLVIVPQNILRMDHYDCEFLEQVAGRVGVVPAHLLGVVGLVMTDGTAVELGGLTHLSSGMDRLLQSEPPQLRLIASSVVAAPRPEKMVVPSRLQGFSA